MLEWIAIPFCKEYSWPRDQTHICLGGISCLAGRFFTTELPGKTPLCGVEGLVRFPYQQEIRPLSWGGSRVSSTPLITPEGNESSEGKHDWLRPQISTVTSLCLFLFLCYSHTHTYPFSLTHHEWESVGAKKSQKFRLSWTWMLTFSEINNNWLYEEKN